MTVPKGSKYDGVRSIECCNCEREGWGIQVLSLPKRHGLFDPLNRGSLAGEVAMCCTNPRAWGHSVNSPSAFIAAPHDPLTEFIGTKIRPRTNVRVSNDIYKNIECIKINYDYDKAKGAKRVTWIAPGLGHSILRSELTFPDVGDQKGEVWAVESTGIELVGDSGIYYPRRITWERGGGDVGFRVREEIVIDSITINKPIPDEVFTVRGMDLPTDKKFTSLEFKKIGTISFGQLVPDSERTVVKQPVSRPEPYPVDAAGRPVEASGGWLWAGVAAAFLLAAVVAAILYRRGRA